MQRNDFSSRSQFSISQIAPNDLKVVVPKKDDGEDVIQCPLDPTHMILRSRMNRHLMKCMKNYNGPPLRRCPFNSMHLFEAKDLKEHMLICEDYVKNKKLDDFTKNQVS